eukprot:764510-Hanusia_phi.AAC.2
MEVLPDCGLSRTQCPVIMSQSHRLRLSPACTVSGPATGPPSSLGCRAGSPEEFTESSHRH